ncbi:pfs domain-containing [Fusarium longipes]|uniref:Pfs domain-containing n=1 Tax=Fusarium longipes TaxID=694270 RepID=A0A395T967_9HYPO|nr:pfs domain-containing [Fusarium longipes]
MHFSTVSTVILATLCASSQAWEVVAYNNVWGCNADDNTMYRVISGAPDLGRCMTFDRDMPGTSCREYRNGGTSVGGCVSGSLIPWSMILRGGRCVIFDQPDCHGRFRDSNGPVNGCSDFRSGEWGQIRSFWCSGYTENYSRDDFVNDSQPDFDICIWAIPSFSKAPYVLLNHDFYSRGRLCLQDTSRLIRQGFHTDDIWYNPQLQDWANAEHPSLLLMQCDYTSVYRTESFSAELCEFISAAQPSVFVLRSPFTAEFFEHWEGCQLLRYLAILALRHVSVRDQVAFMIDLLPRFMISSSSDDWFSVLESVIEASKGLFLVVDLSILGAGAIETSTWPERFKTIMARLYSKTGLFLRVLLISTRPIWSQSDSQPLLSVGPPPFSRPVNQRFRWSERDVRESQRTLRLYLPQPPVTMEADKGEKATDQRVEHHGEIQQNTNQPTSRSITQHQVSIAVLCALTLEADAVEALFDHYPTCEYSRAPGDTNTYSFGVIGRHCIVLVHMPGMGTRHAASVLARCDATFTQLSLVLIVGICGGVPFPTKDTEVLLGDVAVSDALVVYDFGRQYPDTFVRKNGILESARKPPAEILGFLSKLKGRNAQRLLSERLVVHLETLKRELGSTASYPGAENDVLFQSQYRHKHHHITACAECSTCDSPSGTVCVRSRGLSCTDLNCDTSKSIIRQRQRDMIERNHNMQNSYSPVVHIGKFASGDKVMKSGEDRDEIASIEEIIAFEMEGAGVWDNMPCIIIKGVCDYADSHKDKRWQGFAAASGAACMKAILEEWRR